MSTLNDALLRIYRLEGDPTDADDLPLSITSPIAVSVKKVWRHTAPPASQVVTDAPCFLNSVSPVNIDYGSALRREAWSVHARLVCYDADSNRCSDIARAFIPEIIDRFGSHIKLSGLSEWHLNTIRFEGEQPVFFEDLSATSGKALFGLDFFIDIVNSKAATNAGGTPPSWA